MVGQRKELGRSALPKFRGYLQQRLSPLYGLASHLAAPALLAPPRWPQTGAPPALRALAGKAATNPYVASRLLAHLCHPFHV